jgi:hypothetical protein
MVLVKLHNSPGALGLSSGTSVIASTTAVASPHHASEVLVTNSPIGPSPSKDRQPAPERERRDAAPFLRTCSQYREPGGYLVIGHRTSAVSPVTTFTDNLSVHSSFRGNGSSAKKKL